MTSTLVSFNCTDSTVSNLIVPVKVLEIVNKYTDGGVIRVICTYSLQILGFTIIIYIITPITHTTKHLVEITASYLYWVKSITLLINKGTIQNATITRA